jgi:HlyD family secretion protein
MVDGLRYWIIFALSLSLLGSGACARSAATGASHDDKSGTITARRGSFRRTVRLNGAVSAVESFNVLAPRIVGQMTGSGMLVMTKIAGNGAIVHKGDVLVEFDRQAQTKNIMDRQAEYDGLLQQIRKKQADQTSARISDETELKSAEVDVQTARVDMRKNELVPRYQAETNKANLAEAEAQLKQLKETFSLKRQAEAADIRILEIQRDRALKALEYAKSNVDRMTVLSPMDGLVVLSPINKGSRQVDPQEGDEVRPGYGIMLVVNPSSMQVSARINQVDVAEVHPGQPAEIRLDAYPELVFSGKVERISAMGTSSSNSKRIRSFSATISIRGTNPKLLPDLTAAVDIQLERKENALLLPLEAVINRNGQHFVEVVSNGKSELRPVKTGSKNDFGIVVESGLQDGSVVVLHPQRDAEPSGQPESGKRPAE